MQAHLATIRIVSLQLAVLDTWDIRYTPIVPAITVLAYEFHQIIIGLVQTGVRETISQYMSSHADNYVRRIMGPSRLGISPNIRLESLLAPKVPNQYINLSSTQYMWT